jgi:hypothetical protein
VIARFIKLQRRRTGTLHLDEAPRPNNTLHASVRSLDHADAVLRSSGYERVGRWRITPNPVRGTDSATCDVKETTP